MRWASVVVLAALAGCSSAPEKSTAVAPSAKPREQPPVRNNASMLLPENLVSAVVTQDHLLDSGALPGGTIGDYLENGQKHQEFIIETGSAQDAAILLLDFKKTLEDTVYIAYIGGYFGTDKGKPVYVFAKQQYLAGVVGLGRDSADLLARKLAARLR